MMNFIEHFIEPQRLLLAWQSFDETNEGSNRSRHLVAEIIRTEEGADLRYLKNSKDCEEAQKKGFEGYPAFPLTSECYTRVLDTFMRRLPPRTRGDFTQYLEGLRLPPRAQSELSDFALLGYSGAKLLSDGFSIIHPFDHVSIDCELLIEVVRFRHLSPEKQKAVRIGDFATFEKEDHHPNTNEAAIHIVVNGEKIGYVNRGLILPFLGWMRDDRIKGAWVEKFNGTPGRPSAHLYVKIKAQR